MLGSKKNVEDRIRGDGWFRMSGLPDFLKYSRKFADKKWDGAYQKILNADRTEFALLNFITLKNGDTRWDLDYWYKGSAYPKGCLTFHGEWRYRMLYGSRTFENGVPLAERNTKYPQQDLKSNDVVYWVPTYYMGGESRRRSTKHCARENGKTRSKDEPIDEITYAATAICRIYKNGMLKKKKNVQVKPNLHKDGEKIYYGIITEQRDNGLMIIKFDLQDNELQPALQLGDVITSVNGMSLAGLTHEKQGDVLDSGKKNADGVHFEVERYIE